MKDLYLNSRYQEQIRMYAESGLDFTPLTGKRLFIAGASGMIGSAMIDILMYRNRVYGENIGIIAMGRDGERLRKRFAAYQSDSCFQVVEGDVENTVSCSGKIDYCLHMASNTHPVQYAGDPIGTIRANTVGTDNLLTFAADKKAERFLFLSSVEVYGENRGDTDRFDENYCGYLDPNTLRAGYPESKRVAESLCQAYRSARELDVVTARLCRIFGPTMRSEDSKALSQFIQKAVKGEDILLKSEGTQQYSYMYVLEAVMALLHLLLHGEAGQVYNVAGDEEVMTLKELAEFLAFEAGTHVKLIIPEMQEKKGYSTATTAILDVTKLKKTGFVPRGQLKVQLKETLAVLREESHAV